MSLIEVKNLTKIYGEEEAKTVALDGVSFDIKKGERGIWQRRYWEHLIRDERDYRHHMDYIHYNPVKHGYVQQATAWPYSSIHRYKRAGTLDEIWTIKEQQPNYGEPT